MHIFAKYTRYAVIAWSL